jgi:hypothetical protein
MPFADNLHQYAKRQNIWLPNGGEREVYEREKNNERKKEKTRFFGILRRTFELLASGDFKSLGNQIFCLLAYWWRLSAKGIVSTTFDIYVCIWIYYKRTSSRKQGVQRSYARYQKIVSFLFFFHCFFPSRTPLFHHLVFLSIYKFSHLHLFRIILFFIIQNLKLYKLRNQFDYCKEIPVYQGNELI